MKYKIVPVEPTEAMIETMEDQYMPFGEMIAAYDALIYSTPELDLEGLFGPLNPDDPNWPLRLHLGYLTPRERLVAKAAIDTIINKLKGED